MTPLQRHFGLVASVGCLICRRLGLGFVPAQLHHLVDGDDFSVCPLCLKHHDPNRTGSGFHGMGAQRFCLVFKVPRLHELGLLVWLQEDLTHYAREIQGRYGERLLAHAARYEWLRLDPPSRGWVELADTPEDLDKRIDDNMAAELADAARRGRG